VRPLRHTVPLGNGETPASFVSRLAALHRTPAREFCLDMATTFQAVVDGDPSAISIVAAKGGADKEKLNQHAFLKTGERRYTFRGEVLVRSSLRRAAVTICPDCAADDIAAAPHLRPHVAVHGRAVAQIDAIKTCPVHSRAFVVVAQDLTPARLHDFSHHVAGAVSHIDRLAGQAVCRPLSSLESYVLARLDGANQSPFLGSLELHAAIKLAEMAGAVELFGRTPNLKELSDEEWRLAAAAGFDIVAGGPTSIGTFLAKLQTTFEYSRSGTEGPQALFGRLYQWLEFGADDVAYDPVRDVVAQHIHEHLPLAAGDTVFGRPVEARTLHSIRSLHLETGLHPKRARKLLRAAGVIGADQDPLGIFPSEEASRVVKRAKGALSLPAAGEYLNAPRVQRALLVKADILKPCVAATGFGAVDQYAIADLDDFLERLLDGARPVRTCKAGQVNIPAAAKQACCSAVEIVRLILDKKLNWVGRLAGIAGYMSVLVGLEEVRGLVRRDDHGGLTPYQTACELGVTDKVARQLIRHGMIVTVDVINPVNMCPQTVVMPAEVERFRREFVSLFALAKERGRHFRRLKQEMDEAGIEPVFDVNKIGATFYRRKDC
jgi:TniQ